MEGFYAPKSAFPQFEKKTFDKIALIDADKMKHLVTYDVAKDIKNNMERSPVRLNKYIDDRINEIMNSFTAKGYIFCFSGKSSNTFRYHVGFEKEYKGNRKDDPSFYEGKIEDMAEVVTKVMNTYPSLIFSELEADDILSFLQCEETFIYSNDKDLKQIPGSHYDFEKRDIYEISQEEAFKNLCFQLLIGDSIDFIVGLRGCGPVMANKILETTPTKRLINTILVEYQKKLGLTKGTDAFVETWNLVKLREQRGEYFKKKYASAINLLEIVKNGK